MTSNERLERLREKYGASEEVLDMRFRRAESIQFQGGKRLFSFAGAPTFLELPYRPELAQRGEFEDLDIALVGVPLDLGVTCHPGARLGPRALRNVDRIGPYEHFLHALPVADCGVADIGDVPMSSRFNLEKCHEEISAFFDKLVSAGVVPIAIGGDHSITQSILRAVGRKQPVGVLHIDAHCDTGGPYEGVRFHHGGVFRQAVLNGSIDPARTIQIGIRGPAEYHWEFSRDAGMTVLHVEDVESLGVPGVVQLAKDVLGNHPVYISFDIDSIDPGYAPGTGTPEVGGLTPREVLAILRGVADLDIVGGDVVEVAPEYDMGTNTARIAAQILFEILCLTSGAILKRRKSLRSLSD